MRRESTTVAVFGRPGSGKSQLLYDLYTSQAPRVLSLDWLGEARERNPRAVPVVGFDALLDALERAADFDRWHIAAAIEPDDVRELCTLLAPSLSGENVTSLAASFDGMALECGEVDLIAPVSGAPKEVLGMWRRARHYGLSLFMGTQRPASCAVDVRSNSHHLYAFAQGGPHELDAIALATSEAVADAVSILPQYHCIHVDKRTGTAEELDAARRVVRTIDAMGTRARRAKLALAEPGLSD